jgi:hypothetical protein
MVGLFKPNIKKLKATRNIPRLIEALSRWQTDKELREIAEALTSCGEAAVEPLIQTLMHKKASVRLAAALVLGKIGDKRAIEPLVHALVDFENVRQTAITALEALNWEPRNERETVYYLIAKKRWDELEIKFGKLAVEFLCEILLEESDESAMKICQILGRIKDKTAGGPLVTILVRDSYYYGRDIVCENAAKALVEIGDANALLPLKYVRELQWQHILRLKRQETTFYNMGWSRPPSNLECSLVTSFTELSSIDGHISKLMGNISNEDKTEADMIELDFTSFAKQYSKEERLKLEYIFFAYYYRIKEMMNLLLNKERLTGTVRPSSRRHFMSVALENFVNNNYIEELDYIKSVQKDWD